MIEMNFDEQYCPAQDEVFSTVFSNRELFNELLNTVLREDGKEPVEVYQPKCQYTINRENTHNSSIKFDIFARYKKDKLYSMDMQGTFQAKRVRNRLTYQLCKSIDSEVVVDNMYEDLRHVCVTFIMSKEDSDSNPVSCYQLCNNQSKEAYTDLLTIYEVYVLQVDKLSDSSKLRMFLKFLAIETEEDAENFCKEFEKEPFADNLVQPYNSALIDKTSINKITRSSRYKNKRDSEVFMEIAVLNEEYEKTMEEYEKTMAAVKRGVKALRELGQSNEQIAKTLDLSVEEVEQL